MSRTEAWACLLILVMMLKKIPSLFQENLHQAGTQTPWNLRWRSIKIWCTTSSLFPAALHFFYETTSACKIFLFFCIASVLLLHTEHSLLPHACLAFFLLSTLIRSRQGVYINVRLPCHIFQNTCVRGRNFLSKPASCAPCFKSIKPCCCTRCSTQGYSGALTMKNGQNTWCNLTWLTASLFL